MLGEDDEPPSPEVAAALGSLAQSSGLVPPGVPPLDQAPRVFERALIGELARPGAWSVAFNLQALERTAGALRDRLAAAGIEVTDTPDGATWSLKEGAWGSAPPRTPRISVR